MNYSTDLPNTFSCLSDMVGDYPGLTLKGITQENKAIIIAAYYEDVGHDITEFFCFGDKSALPVFLKGGSAVNFRSELIQMIWDHIDEDIEGILSEVQTEVEQKEYLEYLDDDYRQRVKDLK